ncbi:Vacuolar morphogenesis protein 7 [Wickerhamomyces ciferrii]|uniref:Vacuolar morphogenesis protein 7 n=1 Tax=Wickerhamomyces ciferrii (strain ATCC 14091 / BCRC 22168 / CBS 111 / JCM 3599 / NBRC 0793 / NRRL Y-1031 F-60-10) TaxID=1206466 RepID=K0KHX5_WICCF|nr:Vacuolar morphogenesis protein 7 [Wickerhamomyces ciferrii]CCH44795.1 Vacuolar morphogenesis protein 7 [Wickerhamomyces ciferrii]
MDVQVTIPNTSTSDDGSHTVYHVLVKSSGKSKKLEKRYSDFAALKEELESLYSDQIPYNFPKKTFLRKTINNDRLAEERRIQLEKFLQDAINDKLNIKWRRSLPFRDFLQLPPGAFSTANDGTKEKINSAWSLSSTNNNDPITDLTSWIDVVRETKLILQDARSKIFIDGTEARKKLIVGRLRFDGLSKGLDDVAAKGSIGEGEIQRRRELLHSIKREHGDLEQLLSNVTSNPEALESSKTSLGKSKNLLFKGRVLGQPQETERTRGIENQQLLQMQKNDIQDQDQELERLSAVINRQKELGIAINEELALQNELLDELDTEVDRTSAKLKYAQKKVGKIN